MAHHPLPDELVELIARRFRVIGEPMRIRLLERLRSGELSVAELSAAVAASQQNVSKHLGVLHEAGIVVAARMEIACSTRSQTRRSSRSARPSVGALAAQVAELAELLGEAVGVSS